MTYHGYHEASGQFLGRWEFLEFPNVFDDAYDPPPQAWYGTPSLGEFHYVPVFGGVAVWVPQSEVPSFNVVEEELLLWRSPEYWHPNELVFETLSMGAMSDVSEQEEDTGDDCSVLTDSDTEMQVLPAETLLPPPSLAAAAGTAAAAVNETATAEPMCPVCLSGVLGRRFKQCHVCRGVVCRDCLDIDSTMSFEEAHGRRALSERCPECRSAYKTTLIMPPHIPPMPRRPVPRGDDVVTIVPAFQVPVARVHDELDASETESSEADGDWDSESDQSESLELPRAELAELQLHRPRRTVTLVNETALVLTNGGSYSRTAPLMHIAGFERELPEEPTSLIDEASSSLAPGGKIGTLLAHSGTSIPVLAPPPKEVSCAAVLARKTKNTAMFVPRSAYSCFFGGIAEKVDKLMGVAPKATPLQVGLFRHGPLTYFRDHNQSQVFLATPTSGVTSSGVNGVPVVNPVYNFTPVSRNEASLLGRPVPVAVSSLPPFMVALATDPVGNEESHVVGVAWRENAYTLGTALHNVESSPTGLRMFREYGGQSHSLSKTTIKATPPIPGGVSGTGYDQAFIVFTDKAEAERVFARLGVKIAPKLTKGAPSGYIEVYGATQDGFMKSRGQVLPQTEVQKANGVFAHNASTDFGFSGSPTLDADGHVERKGMHICSVTGDIRNLAVSPGAQRAFALRETALTVGALNTIVDNEAAWKESDYSDDADSFSFDSSREEKVSHRTQLLDELAEDSAYDTVYGRDDDFVHGYDAYGAAVKKENKQDRNPRAGGMRQYRGADFPDMDRNFPGKNDSAAALAPIPEVVEPSDLEADVLNAHKEASQQVAAAAEVAADKYARFCKEQADAAAAVASAAADAATEVALQRLLATTKRKIEELADAEVPKAILATGCRCPHHCTSPTSCESNRVGAQPPTVAEAPVAEVQDPDPAQRQTSMPPGLLAPARKGPLRLDKHGNGYKEILNQSALSLETSDRHRFHSELAQAKKLNGMGIATTSTVANESAIAPVVGSADIVEAEAAKVIKLMQTHMCGSALLPKEARFWHNCEGDTAPAPLPEKPTAHSDKPSNERVKQWLKDMLAGGEGAAKAILEAACSTPEHIITLPCVHEELAPIIHKSAVLPDPNEPESFLGADGQKVFTSGGKYKCYSGGSNKLGEDTGFDAKWKQALKDKNLEHLGAYVIPKSNKQNIRDSLSSQAGRLKTSEPFMDDKARHAFDIAMSDYSEHMPPLFMPVNEEGIPTGWSKVVDNLQHKSAGWNSRYRRLDKKAWAANKDPQIAGKLRILVATRLLLRAAAGARMAQMKPPQMRVLFLSDPKEAFLKNEGHGGDKSKSRRWRIIWNASLIDSMCQSLLSMSACKQDIMDFQQPGTTTLHGLGTGHHPDGIKHFVNKVRDGAGECVINASDATGFDFSVPRLGIMLDAERKSLTVDSEAPTEVHLAAGLLLYCDAFANTAHSLNFFGEIWTCATYGMTASGVPCTGSQNSFYRGFVLLAAGAIWAMTVGDDEAHTGDVDDGILAFWGTVTKKGSHTTGNADDFKMLSHRYIYENGRARAEYLNIDKMLATNLLMVSRGESVPPSAVAAQLSVLRDTPDAIASYKAAALEFGGEFWNADVDPTTFTGGGGHYV